MDELDKKLQETQRSLVQATWDISGEGFNGEYDGLTHNGGERYTLEEVFERVTSRVREDLPDLGIETIKQSFLDAGWKEHKSPFVELTDDQMGVLTKHVISKMLFQEPVMTQSDWEAKAIKDGWVKKSTQKSLIEQIVEMTGNEFAMGYDDSGCFWHFHNGMRGNGRMMFGSDFDSESPEVEGALKEFQDFLVKRTAGKASGIS